MQELPSINDHLGGAVLRHVGALYTTSHNSKKYKLLEKYPYQDQMVTNIFLAKAKSIRNKST